MMTFNYLLVVNLTRNVLNLTVREDSGEVKKFYIPPFGKRTDVPQRFMDQLIDNYSSMGVLVQEQPINYLGELESAPARVSEGYSGDFGYYNGRPYYCVEDKVWISEPPLPNQDTRPDQSEIDAVVNPEQNTGGSSGLSSITVNETVTHASVTGTKDSANKTFTIGEEVISGSVTAFINGLPYPVTEDSSTVFTFTESVFAPDPEDTVTVTYKKGVTYE